VLFSSSKFPRHFRLFGFGFASMFLLTICLTGCENSKPTEESPVNLPPIDRPPLSVLIVDDETFASQLERQWNGQSESKIETRVVSEPEFAADWNQVSEADVVIYPSGWMGELASRNLLLKINPRLLDDESFSAADIMPHDRVRLTQWGSDTLAVSLGHRPWVLMYREDCLNAVGVAPPKTWEEYAQACQRLKTPPTSVPGLDPGNWTPTVEPTAPEWMSDLLLARSASYISHRGSFCPYFDLRRRTPLIGNPAYVRGLTELLAQQYPEVLGTDMSPSSGWHRLMQGQCAMAIGWPGTVDDDTEGTASVRIQPLPGSKSVYIHSSGAWRERSDEEWTQVPYYGNPGRLISVTEASRRSGSAWGLISWLSQKQNQRKLCASLATAFPTRYSLLSQSDDWLSGRMPPQAIQDLTSTVRTNQDEFVLMTPPRIAGSQLLLTELQQAILDAKKGKSPENALSETSKKWSELMEDRGSDSFILEWEKSLGL
jgi:multiple sugar transport system substrate-binding protein